MKIPRPLKFPRDIQDIGNGWAIQNLTEYGNSVLPNALFEILDERIIRRLLETITSEKVFIQKTKGGYIAWII